MLKNAIDRERQELRQLEQRIEDVRRRQTCSVEDLMSLDGVLGSSG
jgi:hypothetical protein